MDVSWEWLNEYAKISESIEAVAEKLTMSGLNHESTTDVDGDKCIDLEVTSNRADCLGHIGVAREIATLFGLPLQIPDPKISESAEAIADHCSVEIAADAKDLCHRYTARLIRGVKVGPSPDWLVRRLKTIGIETVNNVVDISNYVMMECGQPLHTFDYARIRGKKIIVRQPTPGEKINAINHNEYELSAGMCLIADAERPVAIGGVMGGAESEITSATRDVLIEAAWFSPQSVRSTARKLILHSDSSFRFERNVDIENIEWASRRCAELIVKVAGGTVCKGMLDVNLSKPSREPITFRLGQIERILGIAIPRDSVVKTLTGLGVNIELDKGDSLTVRAPSWRKDLTREIDLIEEVGRVYGYEKVSDTISVPMTASHKTSSNRLMEKIRRMMNVAGFDEAMCPSLLPELWSKAVSPWTETEPLVSHQPMLGVLEKGSQNVGAVNCLRRTLISSLLEAKRINEYRANTDIDLFETANVYLPKVGGLPDEPLMLGIVSGRDFEAVKGILETVCREINPSIKLDFASSAIDIFDVSRSATILHSGKTIGHIGQISPGGKKIFGLRQNTTAAELDLDQLAKQTIEVRRHQQISEFPAVTRDFNFIVPENTMWNDLENTVRTQAGPMLEIVNYRETFRDEKRDGAGKKRVLLSLQLRSMDSTLSGPQVDSVCDAVVKACEKSFGAVLSS